MKAIDPKENLVLVQFYDPELGRLEEWWFPLEALCKCEKPVIYYYHRTLCNMDQLVQTMVETRAKLANIYARRIAIAVLDQIAFSRLNNTTNFLRLSSAEYLSSIESLNSPRLLLHDLFRDILETEDDQSPVWHLNRLIHKLHNYIKDALNVDHVQIYIYQ